ncbi:proteinase B [Sugiyamaella lignohabitans]|uniref:Proteinase B n=1 Tax=Sugiyamaella lignohabitans TaxID=796027 RepID=A0A170QYI2_9ASCO|nr:proteinase B [Sugiyamaella lignohabitans]ANB15978.1 proteinase B [Sugiyamaella lignohabitans]
MKFSTLATAAVPIAAASALVIPHDVDTIEAFKHNRKAELSHKIANSKVGKTVSEIIDHVKAVIDDDKPVPFVTSSTASQNLIEDSYIVVFKEDLDIKEIADHHLFVDSVHLNNIQELMNVPSGTEQHPLIKSGDHGLKHMFDFGKELRGYSGKFHPDTVDAIRRHPAVAYVEHDSRVFANELEVEKSAPWGLARVSHREPLSLGSFNKYLYDGEGGEGVTAYVVDTGTNINHVDFEGRAKWGKTIPQNDVDEDGNGHGSHCSGTIAGKKYGVAKKANVVAVKVLGSNGSGSMSDVIKGVEFVAAGHIRDKGKKGYKGTTANMSLGGGKSPSLDLAVNAAVRAGVHFAVAAGNDNADACNYSPAAAENAVTVGATALGDDRAYFSNYGECVDIFGPGVNILSTYTGSPHAVATLSGTSMASPHIAGLLTYFLSLQPATDSDFATAGAVTPAQLKKNLIAYGTKDILTDLDEKSPNVLAYNGGGQNISSFWAASADEMTYEVDSEGTYNILPIVMEIKDELGNAFSHRFNNVII